MLQRKGDPQVRSNYRGIAVGGALAKCYASILFRRLVQYGLDVGIRHPAQAGLEGLFLVLPTTSSSSITSLSCIVARALSP